MCVWACEQVSVCMCCVRAGDREKVNIEVLWCKEYEVVWGSVRVRCTCICMCGCTCERVESSECVCVHVIAYVCGA